MVDNSSWYETVLNHIPHGEEGSLSNLDGNELMTMINLLSHKGYAVCVTTGDMGDTFNIAWLYAGESGALNYASYNQVAFTHVDFMYDYPNAYNADTEGDE